MLTVLSAFSPLRVAHERVAHEQRRYMGTEVIAACQKVGQEPDTNDADVTMVQLVLPERCAEVLRELKVEQDRARDTGGDAWCGELVFCMRTGTPLSAENVRSDFRKVLDRAVLVVTEWTLRELRRSFVSLAPLTNG